APTGPSIAIIGRARFALPVIESGIESALESTRASFEPLANLAPALEERFQRRTVATLDHREELIEGRAIKLQCGHDRIAIGQADVAPDLGRRGRDPRGVAKSGAAELGGEHSPDSFVGQSGAQRARDDLRQMARAREKLV